MAESLIESFECIKIIIIALLTTSLAEGALWFLIYRKDEYQNLKKNIENTANKLAKQKETTIIGPNQTKGDKKVTTLENQLKMLNQEMSAAKMKSTFLIGLFLIIIVSSLGSEFQGIVVAKLPFEPFSLVKGMTQRGLLAPEATDCSYLFIYILSSFVFRSNIQKIFGFEPPRSSQMNPFFNPPK